MVDLKLILNILLALLLWNMIIKSVWAAIIQKMLNNDKITKDIRESFKERLEEK